MDEGQMKGEDSVACLRVCPACREKKAVRIGELYKIEGLFNLDNPGDLYACPCCSLRFRFPYPSEEALIELYKNIETDTWFYEDSRVDFHLARQTLMRTGHVKNVLDVGCFRGDFLKSLPQNISTYGIEPSPDAREVAIERGVTFVSHTIDGIEDSNIEFDAVTMLDVIEHLPQPLSALKKISERITSGGSLIISTGNTDALPWKLMPLDYWYYFSEHVSFFNRQWFEWASKDLDMEIISVQKFSHFEAPFFTRLRQLVEVILYRLTRLDSSQSGWKRFFSVVYPFSRALLWTRPPKTNTWRDHMLIVLRKK